MPVIECLCCLVRTIVGYGTAKAAFRYINEADCSQAEKGRDLRFRVNVGEIPEACDFEGM